MAERTMRRLPLKGADGSIDLIEIEGIFYLEAQGEDTLIRTKRKKPYKSIQRLGELAKKLPAPAFVRCHREFIVNFNRVRSIAPRKSRGYDLRLDPSSLWQATPRHARLRSGKLRRGTPVFALMSFAAPSPPVNRRIHIARNRLADIHKILGL